MLSSKFILEIDPGRENRGLVSGPLEFRKNGLYTVFGKNVENSKCLNTETIAKCVVKNADLMAQDIRRIILKLFSMFLSEDGRTVDYKSMGTSSLWPKFKDKVTQLQRVSLENLSDNEKLAFFINIYNVLVIHGTVEKGVPSSTLQRYR